MKISASIYSYPKTRPLKEIVSELDALNISSFHIDCKDNLNVFKDIEEIRSCSHTPIDLHIISPEPEKFYDKITEYNVEYVQFQYEDLQGRKINPPKTGKTKYGLGITTSTPIEVFDNYSDFDFILFMTTIPGESGGQFAKQNFQRIRKFRQRYQNKEIFVDGGVNGEVSFILRNMGVSSVVTGSFLANNSAGKALLDLRVNNVESHYRIADFMITGDDLPVLPVEESSNIAAVLQTIEQYKLGFVLFKDKTGKFAGIVSNADVRKGLLKNISDLNKTSLSDMLNPSPVTVLDTDTIADMLQMIRRKNFIVSFLPVVNNNNEIAGAVTFFNLIRSEI